MRQTALNIRTANAKSKEKIFTCSKYNKYGVAHCSQHRISYDALYSIVLEQIRECARAALADEQDAADQLKESCRAEEESERAAILQSVAEDEERIATLERVIGRVYEDMAEGRITEDNFNRILERSQGEQAVLKNRVTLNRQRLDEQAREQEDNTRWLEIIKDYADVQELDAVTLNRLIQKIVIHEDKDSDTVRQTVEIHFNFKKQADKRRLDRE